MKTDSRAPRENEARDTLPIWRDAMKDKLLGECDRGAITPEEAALRTRVLDSGFDLVGECARPAISLRQYLLLFGIGEKAALRLACRFEGWPALAEAFKHAVPAIEFANAANEAVSDEYRAAQNENRPADIAKAQADAWLGAPPATRKAWNKIARVKQVGSTTILKILDAFARPEKRVLVETLPALIDISDQRADHPLTGKTLVFTGTLESMKRTKAVGAIVAGNVSKTTDYLVVGTKPGSKEGTAAALGGRILSEAKWLGMLKQPPDA